MTQLDPLEASRIAEARPEKVFGMVDGDMLGMLHRVGVQRKWPEADLTKVIKKLLAVGVRTLFDLVLVIKCGVLQTRLRASGQKPFTPDTLKQMVQNIGFRDDESSTPTEPSPPVFVEVAHPAPPIPEPLPTAPLIPSPRPAPPEDPFPPAAAPTFLGTVSPPLAQKPIAPPPVFPTPPLQGSAAQALRRHRESPSANHSPAALPGSGDVPSLSPAHDAATLLASSLYGSLGSMCRGGDGGNSSCCTVPQAAVLEVGCELMNAALSLEGSLNPSLYLEASRICERGVAELMAPGLRLAPQPPSAMRVPPWRAQGHGPARPQRGGGRASFLGPNECDGAAEDVAGGLGSSCGNTVAGSSKGTPKRPDAPMDDGHLFTILQARARWHIVEVPLAWLYFYQKTVAGNFSDGRGIQTTVDELRSGRSTPHTLPLMHVLVIDGVLYGMGTRRLLCYHLVWDDVDPFRPIPVLFCDHATTGFDYNQKGLRMQVIGTMRLDGKCLRSVSRLSRTRGPHPTRAYMTEEYRRTRLPIPRTNTQEVYCC